MVQLLKNYTIPVKNDLCFSPLQLCWYAALLVRSFAGAQLCWRAAWLCGVVELLLALIIRLRPGLNFLEGLVVSPGYFLQVGLVL